MEKSDLIDYWRNSKLIRDERVLQAFSVIPRERFIQKEYLRESYFDHPLPIPEEQTISQPTTVMIMTEALEVKKGDKVLEVGTGSGYQAAILSKLVGEEEFVYTTEIRPKLVKFAKQNLKKTGIKNVKVIEHDGSQGLKKYAPYDAIIVTAGAPSTPQPLLEQLKKGGILIIPVGQIFSQEMLKIRKGGKTTSLGFFRFVELKGKHGH